MKKALVTGASGFLGSHMVMSLKKRGYFVRATGTQYDPPIADWADEYKQLDLKDYNGCWKATLGMQEVYAFAANMGGIGYITTHNAEIMRDNGLININLLESSREHGIKKYFFPSSVCVYPDSLQKDANPIPLKESDAYPANPPDGYGWEKLYGEILAQHYHKDYGMDTKIFRLHNIYGENSYWEGSKAKAPTSLCRKVAEAKLQGLDYIEIWGDGKQTRSFCYVADAITGIEKLMESDYNEPLNLGQDTLVSIDDLADLIMDIAGVKLEKVYLPQETQGARGRNSDNTNLQKVLGWKPSISLEVGMKKTYDWVEEQVIKKSLDKVG